MDMVPTKEMLSRKPAGSDLSAKPLLSFGVIGDSQYAERDEFDGRNYRIALQRHNACITELSGYGLDFVIDIGDMGDGIDTQEIPLILENYAKLDCSLYHVIGNHDLVLRTEDELLELLGLKTPYYSFVENGVRSIVLYGLDESLFSPPDSERRQRGECFLQTHPERQLRPWDGMLSAEQKDWLKGELDESVLKNEKVIIFCHLPVFWGATAENTILWDYEEVLSILDGYDNIVAWFAGHYHGGGMALRNGVLHKTLKAICNFDTGICLVVEVYDDHLSFKDLSDQESYSHYFLPSSAAVCGTAPAHAWVVSDAGNITRVDDSGRFELELPVVDVYALKFLADGMSEKIVPRLTAPAEIDVQITPEPARYVVHGVVRDIDTHLKLPCVLTISDANGPVRWFDVAGTPFGGAENVVNKWHEKPECFWSNGEFVFSAVGDVCISAKCDGYLSKTLQINAETCDVNLDLKKIMDIRERGWYKGDFHAHLVHLERIYHANIPLAAFMVRAEGYDWMYLAEHHQWFGFVADVHQQAEYLSDSGFMLRVNTEFPKTYLGHCGNVNVGPIFEKFNPEAWSNFELAKKYIYDCGGVVIPVHPLFDEQTRYDADGNKYHPMLAKEFAVMLMAAPEMVPCLDLFYFDSPFYELTQMWYMLLNHGYRIGCTASSDTAFDVGRSPGQRGATYVNCNELTENAIMAAIVKRRTMISWDDAILLFNIDGKISGSIFSTGAKHVLEVEAFYKPGRDVTISIVRNGDIVKAWFEKIPEDGLVCHEWTFCEDDDAWYLVVMTDNSSPDRIKSAASPIYFRSESFEEPKTVQAKVSGMITDEQGKPLRATVNGLRVENGRYELTLPAYSQLHVVSEGYCPQVKSILMSDDTMRRKIKYLTKDELCDWQTYEDFRELLGNLKVDFVLRRNAQ